MDGWVGEYNATRPHQSLDMASPAERFSAAAARSEEELLPLRLPSVIAVAPVPSPPASQPGGQPAAAPPPASGQPYRGGPVEFERVVPPSGNMQVAGRRF